MLKKPMTAADLMPKSKLAGVAVENGITVNAINNRLEALRKFNLVTRTRRGKFWVYSRVPSKQPDPVPARHALK